MMVRPIEGLPIGGVAIGGVAIGGAAIEGLSRMVPAASMPELRAVRSWGPKVVADARFRYEVGCRSDAMFVATSSLLSCGRFRRRDCR
jgi:hypothetical protein